MAERSYSDQDIIHRLNEGDQEILKYLFNHSYSELVVYSMKFIMNREIAEEIVQDLFIRLWQNRGGLKIEKSVKGYLLAAVRNRSINYLKSKYARIHFVGEDALAQRPMHHTAEEDVTAVELQEAIHEAIDSLPVKCRIIFNLSRNAGLSNDEIAGQLNISIKTVQAQIGIAIKKLREYLKDQWDNIPS